MTSNPVKSGTWTSSQVGQISRIWIVLDTLDTCQSLGNPTFRTEFRNLYFLLSITNRWRSIISIPLGGRSGQI